MASNNKKHEYKETKWVVAKGFQRVKGRMGLTWGRYVRILPMLLNKYSPPAWLISANPKLSLLPVRSKDGSG
jgi:hypothetical protein